MDENQETVLSLEDELWARVLAQEMVRYARAGLDTRRHEDCE